MKEYNVLNDPEFKADVNQDRILTESNILPEPGSEEYEKMVEFMRSDLENGMAYSKLISGFQNFLKNQGRDFDTEFAKWKNERETTYTMKVVCAGCKLDMGRKPCVKSQQDKISHSICKSCKKDIEKDIEQWEG